MNYTNTISLHWGRRLPLLLQTEATECGLACLAMILGYHGHNSILYELRNRFQTSLKGMTLKQIIQIADQLKLGTRAVRLDMKDIPQLKLPCILHWDFNHFVVLKSVRKNHLVLHDPARGLRHISLTECSEFFTGIALELWPEFNFEEKKKKPDIRLSKMLGTTTGLYRSLLQALLLAFALEILSLVSPFLLQWTIDNVLVSEDSELLKTLVLGFGLLMLMQQGVTAIRAWVLIHMNTMISVQWRANVFTHLLRLPIHFFERRHLADIVSRFGAVNHIQETLTAAFFSSVLDGLMSVATLALMFMYSPTLASISLIAMVLYILGRCIWYAPFRRATEEQIIHAARQESHFLETIRGVRAIKLFRRPDERRSTWLGLLIEQINADIRTQKMQLLYTQLNGLLFGIENLLAVWFGAGMVMSGHFSVGLLMAFTAYKTQLVSRVSNLVDHFFELHMLQLYGERLADIVLHPPEDNQGEINLATPCTRSAHIEIRDLMYRYSDQEPYIIDKLNLSIADGESIAITGASGAGKSTLINLMLGILPPSEGQIKIAGIEVKDMGVGTLRDMVGTVMQDDVLFAGSLAENISFFDQDADMSWIMQCAEMAAIHNSIQSMPMGYSTLVGDMGTVLSGGQKQRVLLARAFYKRARILFLDEATSHLDLQCEQLLNDAIRSLKITRIIVAHRPETIASADRVFILESGKLEISPVHANVDASK
ncbi:peptidase domain-containing ABC transporter [Pseudomonas brassicacearum]|uniref:Peptidase domain-containing ABC transporter n=1 Tax=Pseudomonas brassicacearum TaxID=930166 RepID=A0AAJ3FWZ8_9PSED|nr:peptidase domain-containing ABC transporter [Pseudomonas brassicacearum]NUT80843.1 peptidase domain-containing ABC transporter [Pseudomonas brassicacearum]